MFRDPGCSCFLYSFISLVPPLSFLSVFPFARWRRHSENNSRERCSLRRRFARRASEEFQQIHLSKEEKDTHLVIHPLLSEFQNPTLCCFGQKTTRGQWPLKAKHVLTQRDNEHRLHPSSFLPHFGRFFSVRSYVTFFHVQISNSATQEILQVSSRSETTGPWSGPETSHSTAEDRQPIVSSWQREDVWEDLIGQWLVIQFTGVFFYSKPYFLVRQTQNHFLIISYHCSMEFGPNLCDTMAGLTFLQVSGNVEPWKATVETFYSLACPSTWILFSQVNVIIFTISAK